MQDMEIYDFIIKTIKEAGGLLLSAREKGFEVMSKGNDSRDIVTSIDNEVNDFIIDKIKKTFPDHGIYSEEGGGVEVGGEYQWTIDPIDGSANFSRGIPSYAVCIGFMESGVPTVGAVYNPITKELFSFKKDAGAFLNGKPIKVSNIEDLSKSHVFFHAGRKKSMQNWGGESYKRLLGNIKKTSNPSSSSLDVCFVASGRVEASVYGTLSTLDISSALGILIEAGGVVSDEEGKPLIFSKNPQKIYMANNSTTLDNMRTLLES